MMFRCKLVDNKGYIKENFLREGTSKQEVRESLDSFQWPDGEWQITDISYNDDDN